MPEHPLASVVAYVDFRRFGVLPYPGGSFDQPAQLMDEMRYIHDRIKDKELRDLKSNLKHR